MATHRARGRPRQPPSPDKTGYPLGTSMLGLTPPGRKAITARVRRKPRSEIVARREGRKAARDRFAPAAGSLQAEWPLALVQIDHTLVDVIVVDSLTRAPIQRPWLTLAIDVCSRCVVGFVPLGGPATRLRAVRHRDRLPTRSNPSLRRTHRTSHRHHDGQSAPYLSICPWRRPWRTSKPCCRGT